MPNVISKDGTPIAFERSGAGPALILVDGALCYRAFGPMPPLAALLTGDFTVYTYDRRGRGESGHTAPFAVEREVEDIAALLQEPGARPASTVFPPVLRLRSRRRTGFPASASWRSTKPRSSSTARALR
jgi:pimeloyl-ACP methyl ester carboxylesterase